MRQAIFVGLAPLAALLLAGCGGSVDEPSARIESPQVWMPGAPTPLPKPHTCVAHTVMWTTDLGGLPGARGPTSTITNCRTYERTYYPNGVNAAPERCSAELDAAGAFSLEELNAAMDDREVESAFRRGGDVGKLRSSFDGVDDLVVLHGGRLTIGYEVPKPLERLVDLLRSIDEIECPRGR